MERVENWPSFSCQMIFKKMGKEQEGRYYQSEVLCDERGNLYRQTKVFLDYFPESSPYDSFILDFPEFRYPFLPFPEGLDQETEDDLRHWQVEVADKFPPILRRELIKVFSSLEKAVRRVSFQENPKPIRFGSPLLVDLNSPQGGRINEKFWKHPLTPEVLLKLFSFSFFQKEGDFWQIDEPSLNFERPRLKKKISLLPTTVSEEGIFFLIEDEWSLSLSVFPPRHTQKIMRLFEEKRSFSDP